jgi:hypothetical protein
VRLLLIALLSACTFETEPLREVRIDDSGTLDGALDAGPDVGPDTGCEPGIVAIDFPCEQPFRCLNEREYTRRRTVWCQEIYGDCPCTGGTCMELEGVHTCPEGQRCNTTPTPFVEDVACVDGADAGVSPDV